MNRIKKDKQCNQENIMFLYIKILSQYGNSIRQK